MNKEFCVSALALNIKQIVLQDLAARLAVLTSRATTSGRHVKSVRQPLRSVRAALQFFCC